MKKRKRLKWKTSRNVEDVLLRTVGRWAKKNYGGVLIAGPIGTMDHPMPRPLGKMEKFYVTIECFGIRPTQLRLAIGDNKVSPCCKAKIDFSRGDGVSMGSCSKCSKTVIRVNPRTGKEEWLNGASPWTERDAPESKKKQEAKK